MRRMLRKLALLTAALMIMAVPVLAEEGSVKTFTDESNQPNKDECLLVAMNCGLQVDSIQQRIERIQKEIGRGTNVYTTDELRILNDRLEDANKTLENIINSGGA